MAGLTRLAVLYVDDDAALCSLVKLYLEQDDSVDYTVTTATDPHDALERLADPAVPFDCVVSDYNMPEMDGIEFLEAVRRDNPSIPVLLFSSEDPAEVAVEVVRAGLTDYLRKGVGTDQYTMLVRRVEHAVAAGGEFDPEVDVELDGVGVLDADGNFTNADDTYARLYGYTPAEIVGKHWTELHPDEEVEHIQTHVLPVVQSGGQWTGRSRGLRADGTTFTESKLVTALTGGRLLIAVSELDDRTGRVKRAVDAH